MIWVGVNIVAGLLVAAIISFLMGKYGHRFNKLELAGGCGIGAAMVLTIGPVLSRKVMLGISPFDDWSGVLLRVSLALFFCGVFARLQGWAPASRLAPMPPEWEEFVDRLGLERGTRK